MNFIETEVPQAYRPEKPVMSLLGKFRDTKKYFCRKKQNRINKIARLSRRANRA